MYDDRRRRSHRTHHYGDYKGFGYGGGSGGIDSFFTSVGNLISTVLSFVFWGAIMIGALSLWFCCAKQLASTDI